MLESGCIVRTGASFPCRPDLAGCFVGAALAEAEPLMAYLLAGVLIMSGPFRPGRWRRRTRRAAHQPSLVNMSIRVRLRP
jgi:hypothetical protein